ncbi:MAG TPA: glycosyl hydrolase family 28 protein [Opitutaceae bacterium]|nr:glycosyl hydrolase family 28 protein [Opitutaceae bacterium]
MAGNNITRRRALGLFAKAVGGTALILNSTGLRLSAETRGAREFNVLDYGAKGDGATSDTAAIQRAIDAASASGGGARVIIPGGRRFMTGTLRLKNGIDFHLADDAELRAILQAHAYDENAALLTADGAEGLRITGTGRINGRSPEFMTTYNTEGEIWRPAPFRPRLALLTHCRDLEVRDITFFEAPNWTLHLAGCQGVLVDRVKIDNQLDVPNCDGIDPDHCRDVEIKNCRIKCGDDAIVIKATRPFAHLGGSSNIRVSDCVLETHDSGLKIGTETVAPIHDIRFERCEITHSCRGCTIQLRDEGDVHDIVFRDIKFTAQYHADPWWGRGESISFTAIPRTKDVKVGQIRNVRVENVTGRAENSARISGCEESRIQDVEFKNVQLTLDRWTKYRGGVWDNRPTKAVDAIEEHKTSAIHVRHADDVTLRDCKIEWGEHCPDYFTHALEAENVTKLTYPNFQAEAAHPLRDAAIKT